MSILDKLKRNTENFSQEDKEDLQEWLMKQTVGDLTDYLAYKLKETGKPVLMTIMYLDVKYTISCEEVDATDFVEAIKEANKEL